MTVADATDVISAVATILAVVIAVVAIRSSRRDAERFLAFDFLLRMEQRFGEPDMLRTRRAAARVLLNHDHMNPQGDRELSRLLNFFELLGLLVREGAVETKHVGPMFERWVAGFWLGASWFVDEARSVEGNVKLWSTAQCLYDQLTTRPLSEEQIKGFLEEEAESERRHNEQG